MKNKTLQIIVLTLILTCIIKLGECLIDQIVAPEPQLGKNTLLLCIWVIFFIDLIFRYFLRKKQEIIIKEKIFDYKIGPSKYRAIRTSKGEIILNYNDLAPWKRNSQHIQDNLKIGEKYIVTTYKPWLFGEYQNILRIKKTNNHQKKKK